MLNIHDTDIKLIEKEILQKYDNTSNYPDCDCLLTLRKEMINSRVLEHQEELLPHIVAFNDALVDALRDMYHRATLVWNDIKDKAYGDNVALEARCFLGHDYPKLHPVQGTDRQDLWCALCDSGWNQLYHDGVTLSYLRFTADSTPGFDSLTGWNSPPPNWNEGLDPELTKDLHLTIAFHHLFHHTKFAITDFIFVRNFETEIHIEIIKTV